MNTNTLSEIIRQNLTANVMEASNHLPVVLSHTQRNLATMYLDHLKAEFGEEEAKQRWSVPQPLFISHPAYTEIHFTGDAQVALGASSGTWLRVVYYSGKLFTAKREAPADAAWVDRALEEIFVANPHKVFKNPLLRAQVTNIQPSWQALDAVLEVPNTGLVAYGAVLATEYYPNHSVQKLYFVYHDELRLYLVDVPGWGQGAPGAHRLVSFSIDGLGYYQNEREGGLAYTNGQTGETQHLTGPLTTDLISVWAAPLNAPAGVYAFRNDAITLNEWQYRLTPHNPGDVPKTTVPSVEEVGEGTPFERRETLLKTFVERQQGVGQQAHDYGLLVEILARQVPEDLLRDVFIDNEGSLVLDVGVGAGADERFTFRVWGGARNGDSYENRAISNQVVAVEEPVEADPLNERFMQALAARDLETMDTIYAEMELRLQQANLTEDDDSLLLSKLSSNLHNAAKSIESAREKVRVNEEAKNQPE